MVFPLFLSRREFKRYHERMNTTYNVIRERKTHPGNADVIASFDDENDKRAVARVEEELKREENAQFNFFVQTEDKD